MGQGGWPRGRVGLGVRPPRLDERRAECAPEAPRDGLPSCRYRHRPPEYGRGKGPHKLPVLGDPPRIPERGPWRARSRARFQCSPADEESCGRAPKSSGVRDERCETRRARCTTTVPWPPRCPTALGSRPPLPGCHTFGPRRWSPRLRPGGCGGAVGPMFVGCSAGATAASPLRRGANGCPLPPR